MVLNIFYCFIEEQKNLLRVIMNEMKKKLDFIEKTNWMFVNNFDIHFLEKYLFIYYFSVDPKLMEENQNYIYIDPNIYC